MKTETGGTGGITPGWKDICPHVQPMLQNGSWVQCARSFDASTELGNQSFKMILS